MPTGTGSLATPPQARPSTGALPWLTHWWQVLKDAGVNWVGDRAMTLGSSLAYYTLFSLAPLLLISVILIARVLGSDRARSGVLAELHNTLGSEVAGAIETLLTNAAKGNGATFTILGLATLLFGASGAFVELQDALNRIWKTEGKKSSGVWDFLRTRMLSISAVLSTGFLLLVSLIISSALSIVGGLFAGDAVPGGTVLWQGVNLAVSLGLITCLFALVFRLLPDAPVAWSDVWGGAFLSAALFTVGKYLFSVYLAKSGVTTMYGSAASVVVVLLWVYYSSLILLFGAEVAHSHATLRAGREGGAHGPDESR
jgi:membrane protein